MNSIRRGLASRWFWPGFAGSLLLLFLFWVGYRHLIHHPHIVGQVVDKSFIPAHEGAEWGIVSYTTQVVLVEECEPVGKTEECSDEPQVRSVPVYGMVPTWFPNAYKLVVVDVNGKRHTVGVRESTFNALDRGATYDSKVDP